MARHALLILAWLFATLAQADVERFSPQGQQLRVDQVQARFSSAMVPQGRSDAQAPFDIRCSKPGEGYWSDNRTWVYSPRGKLQAGDVCRFTTRAGLTSLAGEAIEANREYSFSIAGPRVVNSLPGAGATIDEDQVFVLVLNGRATPESVLAWVHCEIQGIQEQVAVKRVADEERTRLLNALSSRLNEAGEAGDDAALELLQCQRTLPAQAKMALVWGKGVATADGQVNPGEQRLQFQVRDHFSAQLRCLRENARAGCMPLAPMHVEFTAPVDRSLLDRLTLKDAKGKGYRQKKAEPPDPSDQSVLFPGPFPAGAALSLDLPRDIKDDKGRPLVNIDRFPLSVQVGDYPPLVKFSGDFGIVERNAGGLLPITLRNLEPAAGKGTAAKVRWLRLTDDAAILDWQARLKQFENPPGNPPPDPRRSSLLAGEKVEERALPKPNGPRAFEVVGLPLEQPGFYVVEAESRRLGESQLGDGQPMYVRASALVTNLGVHFKWGADSSLAWVTSLDAGKPVAGARVAARDCHGKLLAQSVTDRNGMAFLPRGLPDPRTGYDYNCPLYVSARQGDDLSFARSDWDEGIETWRFGLPEEWNSDDRIAHTVLDRVLFRPGDTVHMDHLLRDKRAGGLAYARNPPRTLMIEHSDSRQRWFLPLAWSNGGSESVWKVPLGAKRGDYVLRLLDKEIRPDTDPAQLENLSGLDSGRFSVGDFRVPLMKASLDPTQGNLVATDHADFDLAVGYTNGGGARNLPVKLRARLEPRFNVHFDDYPAFAFAERRDLGGTMEEGEAVELPGVDLTLNAAGTGRSRIAGLPVRTMPHNLRVELEYPDPSGEIQTVSRLTPWWPAKVLLGISREGWTRAGQSSTLRFQSVNLDGSPAAGVPVETSFTLRQTLSYRVRLTGGFYGYHHETRDIPLTVDCKGRTDAKGALACHPSIDQGGEVIVNATARDIDGRVAKTTHSFWVAGRDDWWFRQENHDRMDLIPEKKAYEPGETARFQVRMPFRAATVLVTVEREGVMDARIVELSGKAPVIELPIKPNWAPNVFVSALAVRGRDDAVKPTALVDLGRPAFKLGIAEIKVGNRVHTLDVVVKTNRTSYQVREKAQVKVKVLTPEGTPPPAGTRVILAAVDEGLLELAPNRSWDLLEAMTARRGYGMRTFTAQMQVTGKRHFGKKALPAGGGGGKLPTRELFDTLLFWQAEIPLDARGEAQAEIPLNDSLTAFRVVAVAASENRFGTGQTAIRSTQDLQIISGLSPLVREGDRFPAYFTVRNGSTRAMSLEVTATNPLLKELAGKRLDLAPGESREIAWPATVPDGIKRLDWTVAAREVGGKAGDRLSVKQAVEPAIPMRVQSASLQRLEQSLHLPVAAPEGTPAGKAELRATFSASLVDGQTGLRDYMRHYPYACLEQQVSKTVALTDRAAWDQLLPLLPTYIADNGLANFFPGAGSGSVALTAYLLAIADEAGWPLPPDLKVRMERALADYVAGHLALPHFAWQGVNGDLVQRVAALAALARSGKATPELLATVKPEPRLWPVSALIDWIDLLEHDTGMANHDALLADALAALESRFSETGQRLNFSGEDRDGIWWMMASADTNAVRALLAVMAEPGWKERVPGLVAGILARQQAGRWNTTTANAWGTLALARYGRLFETEKPGGKSYAVLGSEGRVVDWDNFPRGATAFLPLTAEPDTLHLKHEGPGAPYVSITTLAAVAPAGPVQRGYGITREIRPVERKRPGKWSRGDVLRIRLDIEARDDMGWVVVDDPIPAGATILGGSRLGSARGSTLLTHGEVNDGRAWPAWIERRFDSYRAYYEYVPRGRFSLEYTVRLNSDGEFRLPPTRVEAMYAPEMFGEVPNGVFEVAP